MRHSTARSSPSGRGTIDAGGSTVSRLVSWPCRDRFPACHGAGLLAALGLSLALGACAWVEPPPSQRIAVRLLRPDGIEVERAQCKASNGRGSWLFEAPGQVLLTRSLTPLDVTCQAGQQSGFVRALPAQATWRVSRVATIGGLHEMMDPWRYPPADYPESIDVTIGERKGVFTDTTLPPPAMGR